jgi:hypothetical protein
MQPLRPRPSPQRLLRLPFQHLPSSRSQQMFRSQLLLLLLTFPLIAPPLPPPHVQRLFRSTSSPQFQPHPLTPPLNPPRLPLNSAHKLPKSASSPPVSSRLAPITKPTWRS